MGYLPQPRQAPQGYRLERRRGKGASQGYLLEYRRSPRPTNSAYNAGIYHCAQLEGAGAPLPPTNSAYNAGIYHCAQLEGAEDKKVLNP